MEIARHHQTPELQCSNSKLFALENNGDNQLAHLDGLFDEIQLASGNPLFTRDENPEYLFLVKKGFIKLQQLLIDGELRIIRVVRRGEVVGLRGMLQEQPYRYDASAMVPTTVCRIRIEELNRISTYNPWIRQKLYQRWQQAIDQSSSWLVDLSTGSSKSRLAHLLIKLAAPDSNRVCHMPTRHEMASMLGLQSETVSRIYSEFSRAGYVSKLSSKRAALDLDALRGVIDRE